MPQRPAVVVRPSPSKLPAIILSPNQRALALCLLGLAALLMPFRLFAQEALPPAGEGQRYVADIELQTSEQLLTLLERSEQLLLAGVPLPEEGVHVTFVLHGPVLTTLLRDNYLDNKRLVDLAASLSALDVIEVKACNTWMSLEGLDPAGLQPFVDVVTYGPGLVDQLVREGDYSYF